MPAAITSAPIPSPGIAAIRCVRTPHSLLIASLDRRPLDASGRAALRAIPGYMTRKIVGIEYDGGLEHDPESGNRFSEKIMLKRKKSGPGVIRSPWIELQRPIAG